LSHNSLFKESGFQPEKGKVGEISVQTTLEIPEDGVTLYEL
jgi:hypothetical protein